MSRQADITRSKLSAIRGVLVAYKEQNNFARMDIRRAIDAGIYAIDYCRSKWPVRVNEKWCTDRWEEWAEFIYDEAPDSCFDDPTALACVCERAMYDMLEEYSHNPDRLKLLQPITEVTSLIHKFCDREGSNFVAYDRSNLLLNKLDEILAKR